MARAACGACSRRCCSDSGRVRFTDFLKATVTLSGAAATALAAMTVIAANSSSNPPSLPVIGAWWVVASAVGVWLGRRAEANPPIARLLASAKSTQTLPTHDPGATLLNRLWPLMLVTVMAGGLAFLSPQVPAVGAGFAIIWALAWRRQSSAVAAIEQRDGVRFYILRTSPLRPMALQRTPGFKALRPEQANGVAT